MELQNTNPSKLHTNTQKLTTALQHYLFVKTTQRTLFDMLIWWESKRFLYNLVIIAFSYLLHITMNLVDKVSVTPFFSKTHLSILLLSNIFYSTCCVLEFISPKSTSFAPKTYKKALALTLIVTGLLFIVFYIKNIFS